MITLNYNNQPVNLFMDRNPENENIRLFLKNINGDVILKITEDKIALPGDRNLVNTDKHPDIIKFIETNGIGYNTKLCYVNNNISYQIIQFHEKMINYYIKG